MKYFTGFKQDVWLVIYKPANFVALFTSLETVL